ncbi:MAG: ABC transporter substrate-binding protein [Alistipes sp.]|nr:ABC transporter substrate-binding protein [Alistipes sp.]
MKQRLFALAAILWALLAAACGHRGPSLADFDRVIYAPSCASGFEIAGAEGAASTLLRVRDPWQGAEGVEQLLLIVRDGEPVPAGFEGQILRGDARRVVCMSSTHVALLSAAGGADRVVGASGVDYLSDPYVVAHRERIGEVGYEGNVDYERLVSLAPDLVLLFGINGASGMEEKLRELGIPFAYVGEYLEEDPLGKAEWMVAVGETIGRRAEAEQAFAPVAERYRALRDRVAAEALDAPSVMLNTPYGDAWFMASTRSYVARLVADAGGSYIYKGNDTNRSLPIDLEEAALLTAAADMWINAQAASLDDLRRRFPKFADARCVRNGSVYNADRRTNAAGGNDYWESGVVRPDRVLCDLVGIFHPELADGEPFYYRRLE